MRGFHCSQLSWLMPPHSRQLQVTPGVGLDEHDGRLSESGNTGIASPPSVWAISLVHRIRHFVLLSEYIYISISFSAIK